MPSLSFFLSFFLIIGLMACDGGGLKKKSANTVSTVNKDSEQSSKETTTTTPDSAKILITEIIHHDTYLLIKGENLDSVTAVSIKENEEELELLSQAADEIKAAAKKAFTLVSGTAYSLVFATLQAEETFTISVTASDVADGIVSTAKIAGGAVTTDKLAAEAVTGDKISAATITADKLAAGSVTPDKLSVSDAADGKFLKYNGTSWVADDITFPPSTFYKEGDNAYYNTGSVGIGTSNPNAMLTIKNSTTNNAIIAISKDVEVAADETNNFKGGDFYAYKYDISSGVTDSGYRIAVAANAYVDDSNFEGILAQQIGVWARNGHITGTAGRITNSYGVKIDTATSGTTTVDNLYGLYQQGATATNYFEGNVGIGTTEPQSKLQVNGGDIAIGPNGGAVWPLLRRNVDGGITILPSGVGMGAASDLVVVDDKNDDTLFLIQHDGSIGIGVTDPDSKLEIVGSNDNVLLLNDGALCEAQPASGGLTWSCSSDIRQKENITETGPILDWFMGFNIKDFTFMETKTRETGVIAQEVQTLYPEMVTENDDGFLSVSTPSPWKLVKGIQELKEENESLKSRIASLEEKLCKFNAELCD